MKKITRELTTIKKTNESLVNRYCVVLKQLRHKVFKMPYLKHPRKTKNLTLYRELMNGIMALRIQNETEKYPKANADTVPPYMSHTDAQHMTRIVHCP